MPLRSLSLSTLLLCALAAMTLWLFFDRGRTCLSGDCGNGRGSQSVNTVGTGRPCLSGTYTGSFRDGEYEGAGTLRCAGFTWTGQWKEGLQHGAGRLTFSDGDLYEGTWKEGWGLAGLEGEVRITWRDGTVYRGDFADYGPRGPAKIAFPDGKAIDGKIHRLGLTEIVDEHDRKDLRRVYLLITGGEKRYFLFNHNPDGKQANGFYWLEGPPGMNPPE